MDRNREFLPAVHAGKILCFVRVGFGLRQCAIINRVINQRIEADFLRGEVAVNFAFEKKRIRVNPRFLFLLT